MADYVNRDTKEMIICIGACIGFASTLLEHEFRNKKAAKRHLQAMHDQASKALAAICAGLDAEQMGGIMRFSSNAEIICVQKSDPRANRKMYFVDEPDMMTILDESLNCQFCDKDQTGIKNCKVRQALARSAVVPVGNGSCPYKGV